MKLNGIGNALSYFREKYGLSQIQLCGGICPVTTLSRIERGDREFDSLISETLLSRLGKTANQFELVLNEEDYNLNEMRCQLENCTQKKKMEQAEYLLRKYKEKMPKEQVLHQQFHKFYSVMLWKAKGAQEERVKEELYKDLCLTRPDYADKTKRILLFSTMEVKIIYELFLLEHYDEDLLIPLFRFMAQYYDREEKEKNLIPFLYKLVYQYEKRERYYDVIKISQEAVNIIRNGRSYLYLADFCFEKLKGEEKVYQKNEQRERKKGDWVEECNCIFYLYMIEDNYERMAQVADFCKEKLQCQITMPEIS